MQRHENLGMSLVEFVVALAIVAVTAIYAAPMFYMIANNHRATSYSNELVAALTYARVQAVTRGYPVSVCSSDNAMTCTDTSWTHGYIVFSDVGAAGVVDEGDRVLRQRVARQSRVTITLSGARYIRFRASGAAMAQYPSGSSPELSFASIGREGWFDRISPLASAHADTVPRRSAYVSSTGVFMVCAGHAGRMVKLSPQGFITTSIKICQ